MPKSVLIYCRYHTTSAIFIRTLRRLLDAYPSLQETHHFHLLLDDRRDEPLVKEWLPDACVTLHLQYEHLNPFEQQIWEGEQIDLWEKSYGAPNLRSYIMMERALQGRPEDVQWNYLFAHIQAFERWVEELKPELYVSGAADGMSPWMLNAMMNAKKIPVLSFSPSRFKELAYILDNPFEVLDVAEAYRTKLQDGLSVAEQSFASELLSEYREKQLKPVDHMAVRRRYAKRSPVPNPFSAIRLMKESLSTDTGLFDLPLPAAMMRALKSRLSRWYNWRLQKHQTQSIPEGERFLFFPLQYEPEISLATQGRGWTNQLQLAKLLSYAMPVDRWLYIKEHPSMLSGIRGMRFYKEILKLPNVRLLPQYMDSYKIVPKAEAVLTITGTAGWEALMQGKPVVLFGHAFYEEFSDGVVRPEDPGELPQILRDIRNRVVTDEALSAYTAAVLTKTEPGLFIEPRNYPDIADVVLGDQNLDAIGTVIHKRLEAV